MNVNTENLQDMNNIRDKIRWEGVWKWLKEAFRQIKLGDDGWRKAPHFPLPSAACDPNQTTLGVECAKVQPHIFSEGFKMDRLTLWGADGQPDNEWWPSMDENPHVSVLLDMDLLWNYFPSKERPWCIYVTAVLRNLWRLYKEGQSLLIKTVDINPMTLLPDSHLPYIPFMNQVSLLEETVY